MSGVVSVCIMVKGEEEMSLFKTGKVGDNKDRVEKSGNLWTYELVPEDGLSLTGGEFEAMSTLVGDKIELLEKELTLLTDAKGAHLRDKKAKELRVYKGILNKLN